MSRRKRREQQAPGGTPPAEARPTEPPRAESCPPGPPEGLLNWRWHPWAVRMAALVWLLGAGLFFYSKPPLAQILMLWRRWPETIPPLTQATGAAWMRVFTGTGWLVLLHVSTLGLGLGLLRLFKLSPEDRLERVLLGSALGWGFLGLAMLGLGMLGLWKVSLLWCLLAAGPLLFAATWRMSPAVPDGRQTAPERSTASCLPAASSSSTASARPTPWEGFLILVLAALACFHYYGAFMPEMFYDALVYHLGLPGLYWQKGGIIATPENLYSGLPLMTQLVYGAALPLGGDCLCRLVHWSWGIEAALMTYALGRRFGGRSSGLLAAALFYSIPLMGAMSWKTAVENGQAMFQMASLMVLAACLSREDHGRRWTAIAGVLLGFAMGSKYQAWPMLLFVAAAWVWAAPSRRDRKAEAVFFVVAGTLTALPWCVKNLLHYGNPVYPVLHELIRDIPIPRWKELLMDAESVSLVQVLTEPKGFYDWLIHPWRVSAANMDNGSMLLLALPAALLARWNVAGPRLLWLAWLALWLSWSLSTNLYRYLLPQLPLACLLTAWTLDQGFCRIHRNILRTTLVYVLLFNVVYAMTWFQNLGGTDVIIGKRTEAEYLRVIHPSYHNPVYPAIEWVNAELPQDAKLLFLGEARRHLLERDALVMTYYDEYPLQHWIAASRTPEEIKDKLAAAGITHILVNRHELGRWQAPGRKYLRVDEDARKAWGGFMMRFTEKVFDHQGPAFRGRPVTDTAVYELGVRSRH